MPLKNRKILIVEDEFFLADDLAKALVVAGARVVGPAQTVRQAVDILNDGTAIDAAVLDLNLRGEMSYEVADALKWRDIPFAFTTGYDVGVIPPAYQKVPRWEKPSDPHVVVEQLAAMIGARA